MADLTLIRPANDAAALELSNWGAGLIPIILKSPHHLANDLYAGAANRSKVSLAVQGAGCVLFFGHGTDTELVGAGGLPLVDIGNVGSAEGCILISIACSAAKILGPAAVSQGVLAFLGFRDRFAWISRDPDFKFEPAATSGILALLSGNNINEARTKMHDEFGDVVEFYLNGPGASSSNSIFGWLTAFWDQQQLELHGNGSAIL